MKSVLSLNKCLLSMLLGVAAGGVGSAHAGEVLNRVLKEKVLKVATNSDYKPQAFMNAKNELDGFDIDVSKELARRMGATATFVTPGWEIMTAGRWAGRWDIVIGSVTPTAKRAEVLNFPAVYYYTPAAMAVHKDSKAKEISDLNGKTFGIVAASTYQNYLEKKLVLNVAGMPKCEYQVTPGKLRSYGDANELDDLALGDGTRLDAVLQSAPTIKSAIEKGLPIRQLGKPVFYEPLAIATEKGDKEFDDKVASTIQAMKADGTMKKLSQKWYGVDYTTAE